MDTTWLKLIRLTLMFTIILVVFSGCPEPVDLGSPSVTEVGGPFDDQFLTAAQQYRNYGRVDDLLRWAPWLCRVPSPAIGRFSESDDDQTHGQKLYFMFAKNRDAYASAADSSQPTGQVIVKESWTHESTDDGFQPDQVVDRVREELKLETVATTSQSYLPFARRDGEWFKADKQADLFIMIKTDLASDENDESWLYGVVSANGERVISAGKIESCMKCHAEAPNDRVFGLPNMELKVEPS